MYIRHLKISGSIGVEGGQRRGGIGRDDCIGRGGIGRGDCIGRDASPSSCAAGAVGVV